MDNESVTLQLTTGDNKGNWARFPARPYYQRYARIAYETYHGPDAPPFDNLPDEEQERLCRVAQAILQENRHDTI